MSKRNVLWAIVFGSVLMVTGCGDDSGGNGTGGSGGSNGTGGTGGTGGAAGTGGSNGSASSSCEAICNGNCLFGGVNPDVGQCLSQCQSDAPELDDNCGPQMEAYLGCIEANDCNPASFSCLSEAQAWVNCNGG